MNDISQLGDAQKSGRDIWVPVAILLVLIAIWANSTPVVEPGVRKSLARAGRHLAAGMIPAADRDIASAFNSSRHKIRTYELATTILRRPSRVPDSVVADRIASLSRQMIVLDERGKLERRLSENEMRSILSTYMLSSFTLGRKGEVLDAAERAYRLWPNEPMTLNDLGYFLADYDVDIDRAESLIKRALELSTGSSTEASVTDSLGWVYYRQKKYEEAVIALQKAVKLAPGSAEIRYHLGCAYLDSGDDIRAEIEFKKALACGDEFDIHSRVLDSLKKMSYKIHRV